MSTWNKNKINIHNYNQSSHRGATHASKDSDVYLKHSQLQSVITPTGFEISDGPWPAKYFSIPPEHWVWQPPKNFHPEIAQKIEKNYFSVQNDG